MGCETRFSDDGDTPPLSTPLIREEYGRIKNPDPLRDGRMPEVLDAITLLREKTGDEVPLIVALGTPFELLSTTLSFEDITAAIYEDPNFLMEQMKRMRAVAREYGREIEKRGPDVLVLVDGTSQALSPGHFCVFSFPFTKAVVGSLTRPTILHMVDARIVSEVANATGRIIDWPDEVGGYPALAMGTPPKDSDHDGMPDDWDQARGLDPNDPADSIADRDGDGYSNVEEWLHGLLP